MKLVPLDSAHTKLSFHAKKLNFNERSLFSEQVTYYYYQEHLEEVGHDHAHIKSGHVAPYLRICLIAVYFSAVIR